MRSEFSKRISNSTGYSDFFPHLLWQQVWFHKPTPINHPLQPVSGAWQGVYVHNMKTTTRSCEQISLPFTTLWRKTSMKTWALGSGGRHSLTGVLPGNANSKPFRGTCVLQKYEAPSCETTESEKNCDQMHSACCIKNVFPFSSHKNVLAKPSFLPPVFNLYASVKLGSLPETQELSLFKGP